MDFSGNANTVLAAMTPKPSSFGEALADRAFDVGLGVGAAVAMGYLNGRSPSQGKTYHESFGYPTDVMAGAILVFLGGMGTFGDQGPRVMAIGVGCLAAAGARMGIVSGEEARTNQEPKQLASGNVRRLVEVTPKSTAMSKTASPSEYEQVR